MQNCIMKFPQKLWNIVNNNSSDAINWSENGTKILIDYQKLQTEYLFTTNEMFKTRNIDSFIRQLNLYGFKKVTTFYRDNDSNNLQGSQVHEYLHDYFQANRKELLQHVCRKSATSSDKSIKGKYYVHELKKNDVIIKSAHKLSLRECQTALTKALEQAVCQYRRKKYLKKLLDSKQKVVESKIVTNENLYYPISQDCSVVLIPKMLIFNYRS
ncbi:heat shock factor protein 2-like [Leptopilina heterotoma]|uniref:heat shock factor protein 2-like n=1 Tax=Leptopilina heterotoma TaxID=63436 RepID=UPI001CA82019|nr:heat shock factor protein 2-like [Leptopilina heterotoma]